MPEPAESVYEPANKEPPPGLNINPYPLEEEDHTEPALTAAPAQPEEITWKGGAFDVIEGFGSDMPLALALRQVVPAQYAFSFGRGLIPGTSCPGRRQALESGSGRYAPASQY